MKKNQSWVKSVLCPGIAVLGVCSVLAACAPRERSPAYHYQPVTQPIVSKGLTLQLKAQSTQRFKQLPTIVNAPKVQFAMVTIDPQFGATFHFKEARTGYVFSEYFSQQKLVKAFVGNTVLALNAMEIPLTHTKTHYRLDATVLKLSFTAKMLKDFEHLRQGYHDYMLGHLRTSYQIVDTYNHKTVWHKIYDTTSTVVFHQPGQKGQTAAALLNRMMTDSNLKFGHDIARECSFYRLPNISCN